MSGYRLADGGLVDRSRGLGFTFGQTALSGFAGDTLASALLGAGIRVVATSTVHGRHRGVFSAGPEEPCAFVEVGDGATRELLPATTVELHDGLRSYPGRGRLALPSGPDPDRYDRMRAHADVLVVGAGPAGLAAAEAAAATGSRILLVDARPYPGGSLAHQRTAQVDGLDARRWAALAWDRLTAMPDVTLLSRTTCLGLYDDNEVVAVERRSDHLSAEERSRRGRRSRQRVWHIRARQVVIAAGAIERPISFADGDRPGVMLADAASAYLHRFGVAPGRRAVVFTTHDGGYATALDLQAAGVSVAVVLDPRSEGPGGPWATLADKAGVPIRTASAVRATMADEQGAVRQAIVGSLRDPGAHETVDCDLVAVSGGWDPSAAIVTHTLGSIRWDERIGSFAPGELPPGVSVAGAAAGRLELDACLETGHAAGRAAAEAASPAAAHAPSPRRGGGRIPSTDHGRTETASPKAGPRLETRPPATLWSVLPLETGRDGEGDFARHYVDLHRDVTVADLRRAVRAGLRSMEHVKRYTLLGTGPDQGRTATVLATAITAAELEVTPAELGTIRARPPAGLVPFAALAGRDRGTAYEPQRITAIHERHAALGAVFEPVGQWLRPRYYPLDHEDMESAVLRESAAVRERVGVVDVSTLGKIDIQGPDAAGFLDRIYTNTFSSLPVGASRYGLMLGLDGMLFDDGVTTRLAPDHFHMTTTTGNAAAVLDWLEEWLQTEWPDLRVHCTSVTEQWSVVAIVGPRARDVLGVLSPDLDASAEGFPFMTLREGVVAGIPARIFRYDFSGELAFEVNVPWWHGAPVWDAIVRAGRDHGITAYGTETMHVLRAEKGYVIVGQETDGSVTPVDLGLSAMLSRSKDHIGRRSLGRADLARPDRKQLIGLLPLDPQALLVEGSQLVEDADVAPPVPMLGHVTASHRSAALGRTFALALLKAGRERHGEVVQSVHLGIATPARITVPIFYDPENRRRDG